MNELNAETIRRHFKYEEQGDSESVLADMIDEPRYIIPGMFEEQLDGRADIRRVHRGVDAIRKIHNSLFGAFEELKIDVISIFTTDTHGCAEIDVNGVLAGPFDGIEAPGKYVHLMHVSTFTFENGRISSESVYYDRREVMRQVGMREEVVAALPR
jgi:steroid delta-isomerase-like uncharacterized protein